MSHDPMKLTVRKGLFPIAFLISIRVIRAIRGQNNAIKVQRTIRSYSSLVEHPKLTSNPSLQPVALR